MAAPPDRVEHLCGRLTVDMPDRFGWCRLWSGSTLPSEDRRWALWVSAVAPAGRIRVLSGASEPSDEPVRRVPVAPVADVTCGDRCSAVPNNLGWHCLPVGAAMMLPTIMDMSAKRRINCTPLKPHHAIRRVGDGQSRVSTPS